MPSNSFTAHFDPRIRNEFLSWKKSYGFNTAILRVNEETHAIAEAVLHDLNKWVVFDVDHAGIFKQPLIASTIPMIFVDPESNSHGA